MRERINREHLARAGDLEDLEDQEADRAAAEDGDGFQQAWLGEIHRVNRDTERLEHHGFGRREALRHRDDQASIDPDAVRHGAVERRGPDESYVGAKIRVARPALLAMAAGLIGIDGDERPAPKPLILEILRQPAREFMTGDERLGDDGRADATVLVVVQVAPAQSNGRDVDEGLAGAGFAQIVGQNTGVTRGAQEEGSGHSADREVRYKCIMGFTIA